MPGIRKTITSSWIAITTSALIAATSIVPAQAQLSAPRLAAGNAAAAPSDTAGRPGLPVQLVGEAPKQWNFNNRRHGSRSHYRKRHRGARHYRPHRRHRHNDGAAIAGGIIGLTTGLILGGALNRPYYDDRYYGRSRTYYRPAPPPRVYRGRYVAWSPEWYAYCARKYRSFNPQTGYYLAYSGQYRFCR